MRFLNDETAFVVDSANQRVLKFIFEENLERRKGIPRVLNSTLFCSNPEMLEPNVLTLSRSGTVFTSGMNFKPTTTARDGEVWSCTGNGEVVNFSAFLQFYTDFDGREPYHNYSLSP